MDRGSSLHRVLGRSRHRAVRLQLYTGTPLKRSARLVKSGRRSASHALPGFSFIFRDAPRVFASLAKKNPDPCLVRCETPRPGFSQGGDLIVPRADRETMCGYQHSASQVRRPEPGQKADSCIRTLIFRTNAERIVAFPARRPRTARLVARAKSARAKSARGVGPLRAYVLSRGPSRPKVPNFGTRGSAVRRSGAVLHFVSSGTRLAS
jgi:hypothetical protein